VPKGEKFAETLKRGLESAYTLDTLVSARFIDVLDDLARGRAAMSYVMGTPETIASAASDASNIGSGLTIAGPTTGMLAVDADEVSAARDN
jgi:hypothetical protein